MAGFGKVGKAERLLAGAVGASAVATSEPAPNDGLVRDEIEKDILFFVMSGDPSSRKWLTAYSEVQRTVSLMEGGFVPLRPDSPRGSFSDGRATVSFYVPVEVQKGRQGRHSRAELLDIVRRAEPVAGQVLVDIEGGVYDC